MAKKIVRKYIFDISFLSSYFEDEVKIDLIALNERDLKKEFLRLYGSRSKFLLINSFKIKLQN